MKVEAWIVAIGLFVVGKAIFFVGAWWNMRSEVQRTSQELAQLKAAHEKETTLLTAGQSALAATVSAIQIEIAKGFARIEEQIKTLFREQDKH